MFISSKDVIQVTILVVSITIFGVVVFGVGTHKTFFEASILSVTILSLAFFLFITIGLYRGVKLKDDIGKITPDAVSFSRTMDSTSAFGMFDAGEGIAGIILGILVWLFAAFVLSVVLWLFANVFLIVIAAFAAMLYWIFFRAMRLVFKNSRKTKGKVWLSVAYGLGYTVLYNFWIYGIFFLVAFLK
jgi:hypothetical protein